METKSSRPSALVGALPTVLALICLALFALRLADLMEGKTFQFVLGCLALSTAIAFFLKAALTPSEMPSVWNPTGFVIWLLIAVIIFLQNFGSVAR